MDGTILVTGYTGRLGSLVARELRDRYQANVRLLVRAAHLEGGWQPPDDMDVVAGDLDDPSSLSAVLRDVEGVFLVSPVDPRMRTREQALARMAAEQPRPPRIVKISGLATRLNSPVDSGRWHAEIEHEIQRLGLRASFLRPLFFMQNLAFQLPACRDQGVLRGGVEDSAIGMVDVRDIAATAAALLANPKSSGPAEATLTGARTYTYTQVAELMSVALGRTVTHQPQQPEQLRRGLLAAGQPDWHVQIIQQFNEAFVRGEGDVVTDTVARVLQRSPRSLEAYLGELAGSASEASARGTDPFPS
jgi:uncharacterized protein YbjT (DUF2867 family)